MRNVLLAALTFTLAACGQTELAPQSAAPAITAQATPSTYAFNFTEPDAFVSACNGEQLIGTTTFVGSGQEVTDGKGEIHVVYKYTMTGTYTGQTTGMTYTQSNIGRGIVRIPSSEFVSEKGLVNGQVTAEDGSTILIRWRVHFVRDAKGELRVSRINLDDDSNPPIAKCQHG
ncbi:hypothetical protein [Deinococcus hohokamensis]|uniref:Lipoprotein n=1 Tax=Deinococcus hohokamensis TaxID=309883 RepID=A0ABV9I638_9DEIO